MVSGGSEGSGTVREVPTGAWRQQRYNSSCRRRPGHGHEICGVRMHRNSWSAMYHYQEAHPSSICKQQSEKYFNITVNKINKKCIVS